MNSVESLEQLSHGAAASFPEAEPALAIVAKFDPGIVERAVDDVLDENLEHKRAYKKTKKIYDNELDGAKITTEELRLAAIDLSEAENTMEAARPKADLARDICGVRERLAFPMRATATVLSALAIGLGSGAYAIEHQPDRYDDISTKEARSMKEVYSRSPLSVATILGIVGGFAGGQASSILTGREARRRAQKIIAKEKSAEYLSA